MTKLSKSPVRVARQALAVGQQALLLYDHKYSPKLYTQPQLFASLVLKTFFKTDYRGLTAHLADLSNLRDVLGLKTVPHFTTLTTLQKVSRRLLRFRVARRLFTTTVRRFLKRRQRVQRAALDSPGLGMRPPQPVLCPPPQWRHKALAHRRVQPLRQVRGRLRVLQPPDGRCPGRPRPAGRHRPLRAAAARYPDTGAPRCGLDAGYDSEPNHRSAKRSRKSTSAAEGCQSAATAPRLGSTFRTRSAGAACGS